MPCRRCAVTLVYTNTLITCPSHTPTPPARTLRCWYFLFSGALVFVTPYLSLFLMRDLGYAPWLVG
jgi:hypothetical protein